MSTLGNLKAKIASEMKRTELSASSTAIAVAIDEAIEHYAGRRFPWNEFNDGLKTLAASSTAVTLSISGMGRIRDIESMKASIGTRDYYLNKTRWADLDRADSGQFFGYPQNFAVQAKTVRFYPPPNDAYVVRIAGVKSLEDVSLSSTSGASNAWTDPAQGEQLIKLKAKSNLWRDHVRNPTMADRFDKWAERQFRAISLTTKNLKKSGRTRPTQF